MTTNESKRAGCGAEGRPAAGARYRRRRDVHSTRLADGGIALLDTERSLFHGSNEVGNRIWDILEQPRSADQLVATLLEEYDVGLCECERAVDDFLRQLTHQGLVETCG